MYDQQLWYCPTTDYSIILSLYMDGSYKIEAEHLMDNYLVNLALAIDESLMEVDDYLDVVMGWILLGHLPI